MASFDHERPSEPEDFEFSTQFDETPSGQPLRVYISKVGGGTVGKAYTGEYWHYLALTEGQGVVMEGSDLRVGKSATHDGAAAEVYEVYMAKFGD